jgi:mono/diheme cytochrome c family protein
MPPRSHWRTVLATLVISAGAVVIAGALFIYGGLFNVAASDRHWPAVAWLMETARIRSIKAHAARIAAPPGLDDPAKLLIGTEHYASHCALCHGAPGVPKGDIAQGMYPSPPELAGAARRYSDAELFWILKHGIKMTGMPAWSDHNDAELWATVAFLKKLGAGMTEQEYGELVKATMLHGTMQHGGAGAPIAPEQEHHH